jgi:hypothetical protein
MKRLMVVVACLALAGISPASVLASNGKVANDLPTGAMTVPDTLPQTITEDTSKATVSSKDDFGCGAGGTDQATVWYTFTSAAGEDIVVDASASSYAVGVNVFEGSADASHLIACASPAVEFFASAGTTYYVMFADVDGDTVNGGSLSATFELTPPPVQVTLSVNPTATLTTSGIVTVSGTVACSSTVDFGEVDVFLSQAVGRFTIQGQGFADMSGCGPSPIGWTAEVIGQNGRFSGGSISANVDAFACTASSCGDTFVQATLKAKH